MLDQLLSDLEPGTNLEHDFMQQAASQQGQSMSQAGFASLSQPLQLPCQLQHKQSEQPQQQQNHQQHNQQQQQHPLKEPRRPSSLLQQGGIGFHQHKDQQILQQGPVSNSFILNTLSSGSLQESSGTQTSNRHEQQRQQGAKDTLKAGQSSGKPCRGGSAPKRQRPTAGQLQDQAWLARSGQQGRVQRKLQDQAWLARSGQQDRVQRKEQRSGSSTPSSGTAVTPFQDPVPHIPAWLLQQQQLEEEDKRRASASKAKAARKLQLQQRQQQQRRQQQQQRQQWVLRNDPLATLQAAAAAAAATAKKTPVGSPGTGPGSVSTGCSAVFDASDDIERGAVLPAVLDGNHKVPLQESLQPQQQQHTSSSLPLLEFGLDGLDMDAIIEQYMDRALLNNGVGPVGEGMQAVNPGQHKASGQQQVQHMVRSQEQQAQLQQGRASSSGCAGMYAAHP
jgi:hypothetical protein